MLRIDVLGPTKVAFGEEARKLDGSHSRALLHRLMIAEGQPVSAGELMECVWGRPAKPEALRTLVSRCRAALGGSSSVIESGPSGYRLVRRHFTADVDEFTELANTALPSTQLASNTHGRPSSSDQTARSALALWRGRPYGEHADAAWATPTVRRLELTRADLLATLAAGAADIGNWSEVERIGSEIGSEDPYDERAALMVATSQAAVGRRVEALRFLVDFRERLREELGLDPGPELTNFEMRLLRSEPISEPTIQSPTVAATLASGAATLSFTSQEATTMMPASSLVAPRFRELNLAGRETLLTELFSQVESRWSGRSAGGSGAHVALNGEPGIGKTRLAVEAMIAAEHDGRRTAFARWTEESIGAFAVLREVISQLGGTWTLTLNLADSALGTANDHRYDIAVSIAEQWRRSIRGERWLIVLDDIQWADQDSLAVLRSLFSLTADLPICFLCTRRVSRRRDVAPVGVFDDCVRQGWIVEVEVPVLDAMSARSLIHEIAPQLPLDLVDRITGVASGNAFALTELARHLDRPIDSEMELLPEFRPESGLSLPLPRSIAAMCASILRPLSDVSVGILEIASLIGARFERSLLEGACTAFGIDAVPVMVGLDLAVRAGVIDDHGDGEQYSFGHDLMRAHLSGLASSGLQHLRHDALASALLAHRLFNKRHERIAHHFVLAGLHRSGDATTHLMEAARDAMTAGSYAQAASWAAQVSMLLGDPLDQRCMRAAIIEASAQMATGNVPKAQKSLIETASLAIEALQPQVAVEAALIVSGPWLTERANRPVCGLLLLVQPLSTETESSDLLRLAWARQQWNEPNQIAQARLIAAEIVERRGSSVSRQIATSALATNIALHRGSGTTDLRCAWSEELRELIGVDAFSTWACFATVHRLLVAAECSDDSGVDWGLARLNQVAAATLRPAAKWSATYITAAVQIWRGEFMDGAETSRAARDVGRVTGLSDVDVAYALQTVERRRRTEQLAALAPQMRAVVDQPTDPLWDAYAALSLAQASDEMALVILDRLSDQAPVAHDYVKHATLTIASEAARCAAHDQAEAVFATHLESFGTTTPIVADLTTIITSDISTNTATNLATREQRNKP